MQLLEPNVAMREGMRRLASGVSIISARDNLGKPYAMTATSVTSLSAEPASLLVCVNESATIYQAITESSRFAVNLLMRTQEAISNRCSSGDQGAGRFELGEWELSEDVPFLKDCQAVFTCRVDKTIDYGTHRIFIGQIEQVQVSDSGDIDPLLYLNGRYKSAKD